MYQRYVTSTGQPDFQEPNCNMKGSGIGAGWKAKQDVIAPSTGSRDKSQPEGGESRGQV